MLLLVDCSSCRTPLHLPPGATRIRCAICHAFTLIAPEPCLQSHASASPFPFPNSSPVTPAPSTFTYPPPAPSPFTHAPPAPSPFNHAPPEHYPFTHAPSEPSPFNHAPPGPPPPVHGQKRAVIVGVSYKNTKDELKGCINDAKCMKFMLMKRFQFPESCILMLTEEETDPMRWPTKNNITMAMHWLVLSCKPGDSLVFHFSGHGNNQMDYNGDEVDGFDETLLPMDHRTSGVIVDDEINATIVRPLPYGVKLHAIVDACHSGTVMDLPYLCRMDRLGNYEWEDHRPPSGMWKGTSGGEVFSFTGCDDDQTSADTPQLSGSAWTGAMTYAFIQAIERGHGTTYGSLLNAMRSTVHEIFDKNKGRELVEVEGADLLTTLLGLLILGASPLDEEEEVNQAPQKTQEPQLSANDAFDVYEKPFSL
ncbi:Zinc finger LSD1-type [Arabidopsis thaliana x Arabidopsis arenosa]|uniref:Zinc finger LSD1-type n=1 Tax=Arabidopsis thaliana x Arabidopsis arenosa TaxID=1240361 RepID=A0A8T1Y333_9BRAS|nr:Zinc finger LSD1-type [Arabidopsis thaliana x Arabidopsis arenosa]